MAIKKTIKKKITKKENLKLPLSGNLFAKNKKRISTFKLIRLILVSSSFVFLAFVVLYGVVKSSRTKAESITQDTVISQLSKSIDLPESGLISVKRVSDAKTLSNQELLYKNLKNGDYIVMFKTMVLVYDFDSRFIKGVKTIEK